MLKTCDKYKYEVEALKVVDQEIINNWEIEGHDDLQEALKSAKHYADGYDLHLKEDGFTNVVVNKLFYNENGDHDGAEEVACFDVTD